MKRKYVYLLFSFISQVGMVNAQHISEFNSLLPGPQETYFKLAQSHSFQYIIEWGDPLSQGGTLPNRCDFTGFVPIDRSSSIGYLSISSESQLGGVTILDVHLEKSNTEWIVDRSEYLDFSSVGGTEANCSGTVTPWGTIVTCEETTDEDLNGDGYNDLGWAIEVDPISKVVIDQNGGLEGGDKLWALGNFKHENLVIHSNRRTAYQGVDDAEGYLFKFVADIQEDLSAGKLFVYKGSKNGSGEWLILNNSTVSEQNSTLIQCAELGATQFLGIEDVEINPIDGRVYLAVKNEGQVYRFEDSDPITGTTVSNFETYVGDTTYEISNGEITLIEQWGIGNDNLVFDEKGNLWVAQDGGNNYLWIVENGHTQSTPKVKIFAQAPIGSEPTGMTFTPDYKYLFMSIQHPDSDNDLSTQLDAFNIPRKFDKDVALVIALNENLNQTVTSIAELKDLEPVLYPNPSNEFVRLKFVKESIPTNIQLFDSKGNKLNVHYKTVNQEIQVSIANIPAGIYYLNFINNGNLNSNKLIIRK
ncbi:alkaline phosphatase PhoX [Ekhidna sp.]|uniref:alkaline phosphatase PhoX n=1 Tax=Ekhidna sp. TaxID=2608089 RepID=UPI003298E618